MRRISLTKYSGKAVSGYENINSIKIKNFWMNHG